MPAKRYGEGSVYYDDKRELWVGQVLFGARRRRVTARRKADMLLKMRALQAEKDAGLTVPETGTTGAWLDHWLAQKARQVEASTHADYLRWTDRYLRPHLGAIPLRSLAAEDVEVMMGALEAEGLAPKTVRTARSLLVQALDVALVRGKVRVNVAKQTRGPKVGQAKTSDRLSVEEAQAVLKSVRDDRLYPLAVMALYLGVRPGELFALTWLSVDLRRKTVLISSTLKRDSQGWYLKGPKTEASQRLLPLPAPVVTALRLWRSQQRQDGSQGRNGFVFTDPGGDPLKGRDVLAWWHTVTVQAGVARRRFYACRHTAATLMLNNGVPLEVVSKILGHAGRAITSDIYAEVGPGMTLQAAQVMADVLG